MMINLKNLMTKYNLISVLIALCLTAFVFMGESLYTNYNNNRLSRQDLRAIAFDELALTDIIRNTDDTFTVTGPNPNFIINRNTYAQQLTLQIRPDVEEVTLSVGAQPQESRLPTVQFSGWSVKQQTLPLKGSLPLDQQPIRILTYIGEVKNFSIDVIAIDPTIPFNTARFLLITDTLVLFAMGIRYRKLWVQKPALTFLVIALTVGCSMSLLLPPYMGFDEREHFVKAYKTATPSIGIGKKYNSWPEKEGLDEFFSYHINRSTFVTYEQRKDFTEHFSDLKERSYSGYEWSTADTYTPVPYLFNAVGIGIGKLFNASLLTTFYLGRLTGSIAYALFGAFIIHKTAIKQKTIMLLCLFPGMLYQFSLYTADLATYVFALSAVTLIFNWKANPTIQIGWKETLLFTALCILTLMAKLPYLLMCLLILLLPRSSFMNGRRNKYIGAVFALTAFFTLLTYIYATHNGIAQWAVPGMSVSGQMLFILKNPLYLVQLCYQEVIHNFFKYWTEPINKFAYLGYAPEFFSAVSLFVLFFVTSLEDSLPSNKLYLTIKDRLTLLVTVILIWGFVCSVLYLTFNPVGAHSIKGIQPRYFTPLLLPVLIMLSNHLSKTKISPENLTMSVGIFCFLLNQYTLRYLFLLTNL